MSFNISKPKANKEKPVNRPAYAYTSISADKEMSTGVKKFTKLTATPKK